MAEASTTYAQHPRFNMHFSPTSASWLNMVERFLRDLTTARLRRGVFTSVPELAAAIDEYVAHHNYGCVRFPSVLLSSIVVVGMLPP